jgi:NAD(P)-dependent dehydrogenase (short-subunit alcohol dehydrogenase family)
VREIEALGVRAIALRADLAKPAEARRLVDRAARAVGGLDLLVNNAAIFVRTPFMATTPAQFNHLIAVNLRGTFFCAQAAARAMGRRGGRIVNIADVGAVHAWPGYIPYGISKAGVAMLTKGLAAALAPAIQVNAVGPGVVLLPKGCPRAVEQQITARIPMDATERLTMSPRPCAFFATCPRYITGQLLFVDGGATAV